MVNADYTIITKAFNPLELSVKTHPEFFTFWEQVSYKKGEFVCEPGRIERYFYVVITGVLATASKSTNNSEHKSSFVPSYLIKSFPPQQGKI